MHVLADLNAILMLASMKNSITSAAAAPSFHMQPIWDPSHTKGHRTASLLVTTYQLKVLPGICTAYALFNTITQGLALQLITNRMYDVDVSHNSDFET
jgi:hypothetical protein